MASGDGAGGDPATAVLLDTARRIGTGHQVVADAADLLTRSRANAPGAVRDWAASGAMSLTGRRDGEPLAAPGAIASGVRAHLALLAASTIARGGRPDRLPGSAVLSERAAFTAMTRGAPHSVGGAFRAHRTREGWVGLSLARDDDLTLVPALVERDIPVPVDVGAARELVDSWASSTSAKDVADRIRTLGLAGGRIPDAGDPMDEQTVFRRVRGGDAGTALLTGPAGAPVRSRDSPLVVDFSALWAGPLCAHLLGLTGARVTKVEFSGREDGARRGNPDFYDLLHHGHGSIQVDPRSPGERDLLAALVDSADVVIEASRPRALRAFGLEAERAADGGTVWLSITAYGRTGPWSDGIGFGDDVAAAAGAVARPGGPGSQPWPCGDALADPVSGTLGAAAVSAALALGRGMVIDLSMHGAVRDLVHIHPGEPHEVTAHRGGWMVRDAHGLFPVALPVTRTASCSAPVAGAHDAQLPGTPG